MAVKHTVIEAVRVVDADGVSIEYPWDPTARYLIRDDRPYLEFLTRGRKAEAARSETKRIDVKLSELPDSSEEGTQWQKWDFESEVARRRRLGEISLELKVPRDCVLRCYIIPTLLLNFRDIMVMVEEIKEELGIEATWDMLSDRPDRSWARTVEGAKSNVPTEMIKLVEEELQAAQSIRRMPFEELASPSHQDTMLAENALVSHWAARRSEQVHDLSQMTANMLVLLKDRSCRKNPLSRQTILEDEKKRLSAIIDRLVSMRGKLSRLITGPELATSLYPSPLFLRDHRLRLLLRVFAPSAAQTLSDTESTQSHYPPTFLNNLWELWGAVWLARELRRMGFSGLSSIERVETVYRCSWHLKKDEIEVDLDFEAEPALIDYDGLPPVYARTVSTMEWAAQNQKLDEERPYFGLEMHCSPDYLLRITTPARKVLMVGDACLASPKHHGKKKDKSDTKPHVVEQYRRTIGWSADGELVCCHPLGSFVLYPPPADAWKSFERLPAASDCTLLCPRPGSDPNARHRLEQLLIRIAPEFANSRETAYKDLID